MKIIMRNPQDLKPYDKNAKTHPQAQIDLIAHSIHHFGEDQPIVVDENDVIIKGHGRRLAHIQLGSKKCQVIVRKDMTETEKRAARLADNRSAESPLDRDILKTELDELNLDMNLDDIGFDRDYLGGLDIDLGLDDMTEPPGDTEPEIDKAEELQKTWKTEPGQVWALGDHRLVCGDCTDEKNVKKITANANIALTEIDPPYEMDIETQANVGLNAKGVVLFWGLAFELFSVFQKMKRKPDVDLVWRFYFGRMYSKQRPFCHHRNIWVYNLKSEYNSDFRNENGQPGSTFFESSYISKFHKHEKNVEHLEYLLNMFSKKKQTIFSPFLGSGTTLIACHNQNRICYGTEIDPGYCAVILQRFSDHTGIKPYEKM